jgi:predicted CopG family antitoxin
MTTIAISLENREELVKLGTKDDTFDDIIGKLLRERKQK